MAIQGWVMGESAQESTPNEQSNKQLNEQKDIQAHKKETAKASTTGKREQRINKTNQHKHVEQTHKQTIQRGPGDPTGRASRSNAPGAITLMATAPLAMATPVCDLHRLTSKDAKQMWEQLPNWDNNSPVKLAHAPSSSKSVLGKGSHGCVELGLASPSYMATDSDPISEALRRTTRSGSCVVALKFVKLSHHTGARYQDLLSELQALKKCGPHPNVIKLMGAFTQRWPADSPERLGLVLECAPLSLDKYIRRVGCLSPAETGAITWGAAHGLAHIHRQGLLHAASLAAPRAWGPGHFPPPAPSTALQ